MNPILHHLGLALIGFSGIPIPVSTTIEKTVILRYEANPNFYSRLIHLPDLRDWAEREKFIELDLSDPLALACLLSLSVCLGELTLKEATTSLASPAAIEKLQYRLQARLNLRHA